MPPYPIIVKNETGSIQEAYSGSGGGFADLVINRDNKNNLFFEADYSSVFNGLDVNAINGCSTVTDYNISLVRTGTYVFQTNMYNLMDYYKTNYENLKKEFKVPPGNEFGLGFKQSNGTVIILGGKGIANVYATETPVQYFDNNANIQSGFIDVEVW
jgi:hypothetical protein